MTVTLWMVLGVLGAWRLARDYVHEEGPFGLYGRTRRAVVQWAERRIDASAVEQPHEHAYYWLYDGPVCIVCMSFWSAFLMALGLLVRFGWSVLDLPVLWLGLAGGALLLDALYWRLRP